VTSNYGYDAIYDKRKQPDSGKEAGAHESPS